MKKTWYYRLLFSYMPVFFLMISFLFFIFFQILSDRAQQDTSRIYASVNNQIVQSVEQTLKSIDHLMVTMQTRNNGSADFNLLDYFDQEGQPSVFFTHQATQEFNNMKQLGTMIHSIYLVRDRDGYVLSSNRVSPLEQFPDRTFIAELKKGGSYHWTDERSFKEFATSREEPVVSLARKYLTNRGESGLMIVNVQVSALEQLVSQRIDRTSSYVTIKGKDGLPLLQANEQGSEGTAISTIVSDYTGWTYESGLAKGSGFSTLRTLSNIWVAMAIGVAILGLLSIVYMTHRNYRPLRSLISKLDRISSVPPESVGGEERNNEFHYIESTFDSLVERFNLFKSQSDLNIGYRKKSIFLEAMSGSRSMAAAEWNAEMERHGFSGGFRQAAVVVVSIDKYSDVLSRYKEQDMILFRFIIQNMYVELVQKFGLRSWSEWMNDKEMCGFVYVQEDNPGELIPCIQELADSALAWIRAHLPFTITFGIGPAIDSVPLLKSSYKAAVGAVNDRVVLGNNRIIGYWETAADSVELYHFLEQIRRLVYAFRMMEPEWRAKYAALCEQLKLNRPKRDEIVNLLNYFAFHLFEHIRGNVLNDEMIETNKAIMKDVIDQFETLEDVQEEILGILEKLEYALMEKAGKGGAAEIAIRMRQYIDEHVSNPDLSLVHLSQLFDIPSRNVSSLFKEQFDIKFIDFLIHRRVELAKKMLMETDLSVQDVGQRVGYLNSVSFNRVFKRVVGMPPGDYRKEQLG
ncbi:helix-turn-helix transcriptional regulator [Cohnella nanjingensis]|uniref:AraC family transcriptional regulator n=1 Tax=Cohnella nanjingensis TaxID=1387779 RepID=A0A7X0RNE0_9BACL|nr:AraC family transcriptional regulator [Cohnella nanjingensis]MBB6670682.1 AraC family transcriptional regulator [Cohnella nanjingensis]